MGTVGLDQIRVTPLGRIQVAGGDVLHALRQTDVGFSGFGEAYFSWIQHGALKAWKRHTKMTMNLVVPIGSVRFVFFDNTASISRQEVVGVDRYMRVTVPPGIWVGFQGVGEPESLILNLGSIIHAPEEVDRLAVTAINFNWKL